MSAPALVLDVVPPPDLPPVRPRSRLGSGLFVALVLGLVTSLSLVMAPPAKAWAPILVPVAQTLGATAAAAAVGEGISRIFSDGTDDTGGDDEDSRRKRGKWGDKLKGAPGLAVGLLGALWGAKEGAEMLRGEGDGAEMPEELEEDLTRPALGTHYKPRYAEYVLDEASKSWESVTGTDGVAGVGFKISVISCRDPYAQRKDCPTTEAELLQPRRIGTNAFFNCYNPSTGGYWTFTTGLMVNGVTGPACIRAITASNKVADPVVSVILRTDNGAANSGTDKAYGPFNNPDLNPEDLGEGAPPIATVTAEVQCLEPGTGNRQTLTKSVASDGGVIPLAPCPRGWQPESVGWTQTVPGGSPEYLGGIKPTTPATYPDCAPGQCVRTVYVDGLECNALRPECFDWMNTQPPTRVRCEFGPYNMPIAECADLEHLHKSTHGVTWGPNPETGTPQWLPAREDGGIDSTRVGTVYFPEDNPNREYRPPLKGPLIQIGGEPSNPGQPDPPPPTVQIPPPVVNPPVPDLPEPGNGTKNCIAGMASWNPVDWVFTPVKCALSWAFIPKNGTGADLFGDFRQKFTDSGIGPWLSVPPDLFGDLPQGGGCQGPALTMPESLGGKTYYPLNACSDPMAKYANMSRSLITVVVVFYGMFSVVNSLTTALTGYRMFDRETAQVVKGMD